VISVADVLAWWASDPEAEQRCSDIAATAPPYNDEQRALITASLAHVNAMRNEHAASADLVVVP